MKPTETTLHPMLNDIIRSVDNVSDTDISRVARTLGKREKNETFVRIVDDKHLIQIWTLGFIYMGQSDQYGNMAVYESRDAEEARKFRADSARYRKMADLCQDIFWLEAMSSDPTLEALLADGIGIRDGFELVTYRKSRNSLQELLGGIGD